ncbi:MAG: hypothetical protein CM15mP68_1170 [Pseudomonadota bacterium]|nr:MAG: hypothetical protein CM15mP68_1170 [Pseudomonadota bacterium]
MLEQHLKVPVIDHWWQTETGWSICANPAGIELLVSSGSCGVPAPGWDLRVLDEAGQEVAAGEEAPLSLKRRYHQVHSPRYGEITSDSSRVIGANTQGST